jgi:hypothetical protein
LTADLLDRLERTLSAVLGTESRRDTVKAGARFLYTLSRWSPPGEDIKPTTAKQADLTAGLCDRLERMLSAPDVERRRDAVEDVVDFLFSVSWPPPGEYVDPPTRKQAERELLVLREQVGALRSRVGRMSKTAIDAMGADSSVLDALVQTEEAAQRALERLCARPGRPRARRADWVTLIAASVFSQLTGTLPTLRTDLKGKAHGPFIVFLKAVFIACDIPDSAEARAKAFIRKFCQPRCEPGTC